MNELSTKICITNAKKINHFFSILVISIFIIRLTNVNFYCQKCLLTDSAYTVHYKEKRGLNSWLIKAFYTVFFYIIF